LNFVLDVLDLLDRLGCAVVLLDSDRRLVARSRRAERILAHSFVIEDGRLVCEDAEDDLRLERLFQASAMEHKLKRQNTSLLTVIQRWRARPVVLQAIPADVFRSALDPMTPVALLVTPLDVGPELSASQLVQVFRLTPAEARLCTKLASGLSFEEIACRSNTAVSTVRNQAKSIFKKTKTKRQGELVSILSRVARLAAD
jgi:DNA-binding CsgD family transcriptional regulator